MSAPTGYPISSGCVLAFVLGFIGFLVVLFCLSECHNKMPRLRSVDDAATEPEPAAVVIPDRLRNLMQAMADELAARDAAGPVCTR